MSRKDNICCFLASGLAFGVMLCRPAAVAATAPQLWPGVPLAMSAEAFKATFPAAFAPKDPQTLIGGEREAYRLQGLSLAGEPAWARFFFKDGRLAALEVTPNDVRAGHTRDNLAIAHRVVEGYTRRYGRGYDCADRSDADVTSYECKWSAPGVSIRLWYMDVAGQAPDFYVATRAFDDPNFNT